MVLDTKSSRRSNNNSSQLKEISVPKVKVIEDENQKGHSALVNKEIDDTFHLVKDSWLLNQVSQVDPKLLQSSVKPTIENNTQECVKVEVKEHEIRKCSVMSHSKVTAVHVIPESYVEMVELSEDTETDADETDEEKWPQTVYRRKNTEKKSCLSPCEILVKRQKLASNESLKSSLDSLQSKIIKKFSFIQSLIYFKF